MKAVWQFFEAERDGNAIHLFGPGGDSPIHTFQFGRQRRQDGLCLSDYILDPVKAEGVMRPSATFNTALDAARI